MSGECRDARDDFSVQALAHLGRVRFSGPSVEVHHEKAPRGGFLFGGEGGIDSQTKARLLTPVGRAEARPNILRMFVELSLILCVSTA